MSCHVMQADIEGAELKILPDMVMTGALRHVDNLHMEWHGEASYRLENISIFRKYFNDLHCRRGREPQMIDKLEKAITAIGNYNKRSISQNIEFINSSSSGADSERGHGGSVRDR